MADDGLFTLKRSVVPHGTTKVNVVYTNDPSVLEHTLKMYEQKLLEDRSRFVGLDLEYTADQVSTAVVQLAMDDHVLVYHFCRYVLHMPSFILLFFNIETLPLSWICFFISK